jgi:hypothetical protein
LAQTLIDLFRLLRERGVEAEPGLAKVFARLLAA